MLTCFSSHAIGLIRAPWLCISPTSEVQHSPGQSAQTFIEPNRNVRASVRYRFPSRYVSRACIIVRYGIVSLRKVRIIKSRPFVSWPPLPPRFLRSCPRNASRAGRPECNFFALKRYLPDGGGRYLYSVDYKGINSEQLDFSGRAAPHSRGRSSRGDSEIRLPHEGAAQVEEYRGKSRDALFGNILRNRVSQRSRAHIAQFLYDLAKVTSRFTKFIRMQNEESKTAKSIFASLTKNVGFNYFT